MEKLLEKDFEYYVPTLTVARLSRVTTKPKTHEFTLNYESSESLPDDEALFEELGNIVPANIHEHTDAGSTYDKSQLLNGATGGVVGSVLTIPVGVGDKINASVYAKYLAPTGTTNPTAAVGSLLAAALTGNTGTLNYEGSVTSSYGTSGSMVTNMYGDDLSDTEPKAFINLMFLSDDITETPVIAFNQIKSASGNAHAQLALPEEFVAPSAGYIVVYLSNESDKLTEVYFDDLVVTVNEHPVIQKDDYYPFGLQHDGGFQRVTAKENRFKYNGFEEQTDLDWNVYDYQARYYDPVIGRFLNVDPAADLMRRHSPYNYAFDNPIRFIDPDGMMPEDKTTDPEPKKVSDLNPLEKTAYVFFMLMNKLGEALNGSEGNDNTSFSENIQRSSEFVTGAALEVQGAGAMVTASYGSKSSKATNTAAKVVNAVDDKVDDVARVVVNGNSKVSTKAQHGYEIINETKGARHKVGVSGGQLNKNGSSRRANSQVNKLNKAGEDNYNANILVTIPEGEGARQGILTWEQHKVDTYFRATGTSPPVRTCPNQTYDMITREIVQEFFNDLEQKGDFDPNNLLLCGYYFLDADVKKLKSIADILEKEGYTFAAIFKADMEERSGIQEYYLQVEKVEKHDLNSLMRRNNEFYELAIKQGISSYDGFDIGHPE